MLRGRQAVVCDSCRAGTICIICELVDMRSLGLLAVTAFAVIILAVVVYPYFSQSGPALRLGGGTDSLDRYRGKVVLVNLWASWCAPCRSETPALEQLYKENRARG